MTRRRTFRWIALPDRDRVRSTLRSYTGDSKYDEGVIFDRFYARLDGSDEIPGIENGTILPEHVEIFILDCVTAERARLLAAALSGAGGLAAIIEVAVEGAELLIEYTGNPVLLFAVIDELTADAPVARRPLLPLCDATLLAMAAHLWNTSDLEPIRILEIAAGGDPW